MKIANLVEIKKGNTGTGLLVENDGYISIDLPDNKVLKESISNHDNGERIIPKPFIVSAVFQKFDIENANGRVYPEKILKREVEKYQELIKTRGSIGDLNHPSDAMLNAERIALLIVDLHWVGHTLVGKIEIPITPGFRKYGICSCVADLLAHWILSGIRVGVSSRALGSVKQVGGQLIVQDDLEILCWDAVGTPSTPNAFIDIDENNLQPYIQESHVDNKKTNILTEDKFTKFDAWLND